MSIQAVAVQRSAFVAIRCCRETLTGSFMDATRWMMGCLSHVAQFTSLFMRPSHHPPVLTSKSALLKARCSCSRVRRRVVVASTATFMACGSMPVSASSSWRRCPGPGLKCDILRKFSLRPRASSPPPSVVATISMFTSFAAVDTAPGANVTDFFRAAVLGESASAAAAAAPASAPLFISAMRSQV